VSTKLGEVRTTIPTAKANPAREMTLIERPAAAITKKVATIEMGIESPTTKVPLHDRKNSSRTRTARVPPIKMLDRTRLIAESM